jgi:hypothetical protein
MVMRLIHHHIISTDDTVSSLVLVTFIDHHPTIIDQYQQIILRDADATRTITAIYCQCRHDDTLIPLSSPLSLPRVTMKYNECCVFYFIFN